MPRRKATVSTQWESDIRLFGLEPHLVHAAGPAGQPHFPEWLADTGDPAMGLANWQRLVRAAAPPRLTEAQWKALLRLLGGSQSLSNLLHNVGPSWGKMFKQAFAAERRSAEDIASELSSDAVPVDTFAASLHQLRDREYLRIGIADLSGAFSVVDTMREITTLAEAAFRAAYAWVRNFVIAEYGQLWLPQAEADGGKRRKRRVPQPFVVLGMGKLGGGELNFSSDVDVIYLYGADGDDSDGGSRGKVGPREYCARIAELLTRTIQNVSAGGFSFRVDLRLRPDGMNGPIVNPADNALRYYESYGQTWERTALIQARPLAGSAELGETFLRDLRPFIFRRFLDFATVADMKGMKAKIETEMGDRVAGNVKLGRGGIREVEFIVQVLQLVYGGRDERVRTRGTLTTLDRLIERKYLPGDEGERLREAYLHLRDVEHKIQILHHRQTHTLPTAGDELLTLARRLGYRGDDAAAQMAVMLDASTSTVRQAFEQLFYEPSAKTRRTGEAEPRRLIESLDDRALTLERLRQMGMQRPEESYDNLLLLRDGGPSASVRMRRRAALDEIAPALLAALQTTADPDLALQNLVTFMLAVGARTSFFALLRENPATLEMLVTLFGGSQFLANQFIGHPELLDSLVRADLVRVNRSRGELQAELQPQLETADDFEEALEVLRRFRNQEFLRIGINDLQGVLKADDVASELANLAEACLEGAEDVARREVSRRYGYTRLPGRIAVLAMGKLGGRELNYNSDLDLIFVYEEERVTDAEVGHERFSKFVQCMLTALQVPTKEGLVYRIDTRLRPSGRTGPLVSSLAGFREYHQQSAQLWERQALIKARVVCGHSGLALRLEKAVEDFVYRAPLLPAEAAEIRRMRHRMEVELAHEDTERVNIKTGRGGLVDIEFLVQMLQLHYGATQPSVRGHSTLAGLTALEKLRVLSPDEAHQLREEYRFLRSVESALRLACDHPVAELHRTDGGLATVARRVATTRGSASVVDLWAEYHQRRELIRRAYDHWFDLAERGELPAP